jgi:hypothetical protein
VPVTVYKGARYDIMKLFAIPNILIRLIKAMNDSAYHVKIGLMMTDGFTVGNLEIRRWITTQRL